MTNDELRAFRINKYPLHLYHSIFTDFVLLLTKQYKLPANL